MQTLHDMLKHEPDAKRRSSGKQEDLRQQYNKIGISAVAAATQFNRNDDKMASAKAEDSANRSSARGWSRHG
jgi:hypothetical protein